VVIKAATDESTGGGFDVVICRSEQDLVCAMSVFSVCREVVVESYMDICRNLCLHFSVTRDGCIEYLGFAQQVSDEMGRYRGNWIESEAACPPAAIAMGFDIMHSSFVRGYYGVAGMDVAVLPDGSCKVFDLNFRGNGSTPAVLYARGVQEKYAGSVIRFRRFIAAGSYQEMLAAAYRAMAANLLLPLGSCDPEAGPYCSERPLLIAMIPGETRQHVIEMECQLAAMGLLP
jgi:hypothetical protein